MYDLFVYVKIETFDILWGRSVKQRNYLQIYTHLDTYRFKHTQTYTQTYALRDLHTHTHTITGLHTHLYT